MIRTCHHAVKDLPVLKGQIRLVVDRLRLQQGSTYYFYNKYKIVFPWSYYIKGLGCINLAANVESYQNIRTVFWSTLGGQRVI